MVKCIEEAVEEKARIKVACECVGISFMTYQRWKSGMLTDKRKGAVKYIPRKLSNEEEDTFYEESNSKRFRDKTPGEIVAILLSEGKYYASESTLYRILRKRNALWHRQETRKPRNSKKPDERTASKPNVVWTWDITWLRRNVAGLFFYSYVIIDLYSRKIVGWTVEDKENQEYARDFFDRTINRNGVSPKYLHSDNGNPMKGVSLMALLHELNVGQSFNRPSVSNDNPFIESFFGTMKIKVGYPKSFATLEEARIWMANFVNWYNNEHLHSGIGYVTPEQRYNGQAQKIYATRQEALNKAAELFPERFVKGPRSVTPANATILNKVA